LSADMRSLDDASDAWNEVKQYQTLNELREAVRLDGASSIATTGGRSLCWKVFLLFETLDTSTWIRTLSSARSAYNSLKSHFLRHIENPDELTTGNDPLSGETEVRNLDCRGRSLRQHS
jgi:TBC1 domain family protein 5